MSSDGDRKPASSGKGKGREGGSGDAGEGEGQRGSLLTSLADSARSSVTPSNLSSLVAANGKPSAGLPSSTHAPSQAFEDAHRHASSSLPSSATQSRLPRSGAVRQSDEHTGRADEDAYRDFSQASDSTVGRKADWQEQHSPSALVVGPYSSALSLDPGLHEQVRASSFQWNGMDEAWTEAQASHSLDPLAGLHDPAYHEAWTRHIPNSTFGHPSADWRQGEHIDELLQSVSLSEQQPGTTPMDLMALLDDEEAQASRLHPPAAEDGGGMSDEQREMHRALDELQNSKERQEERVRPPDDDAAARTGVYAGTPAEALQAVWDGNAEGERASAVVREDHASTDSLPRKMRALLKRGSYVDDVYGIPPQLERTMVEAEEEETEENRDRRAKAIRRLDALYRHLGASPQSSSINDFVRDW